MNEAVLVWYWKKQGRPKTASKGFAKPSKLRRVDDAIDSDFDNFDEGERIICRGQRKAKFEAYAELREELLGTNASDDDELIAS